MKVKAGTLSFNLLDSGSGEPALLFLHYWGGSARTWQRVIANLGRDFRCIAYDQRGWGQSDAPAEGYSIRDLAADARHILEALDLNSYGSQRRSVDRSGSQGATTIERSRIPLVPRLSEVPFEAQHDTSQ